MRRAVRKTYLTEKEVEERRKAVGRLFFLWKKQKIGAINYKQLVENGRKR